jgi:hypothetical protein
MIKSTRYKGRIAVTVKDDECFQKLKAAGVDLVFNVYSEAGSGFANHVCQSI